MRAFQLKKTLCIEPESDEESDALNALIRGLEIKLDPDRREQFIKRLARTALRVFNGQIPSSSSPRANPK